MRQALAIASAALIAAGLAACGEKDEPEPVTPTGTGGQVTQTTTTTEEPDGGGGDKKQPPIKLTVEIALNGSAQSICSGAGAVTSRYVRSAYGDEQGCEAAIKRLPVFDVEVSDIKVQGDTATAKAVPDGGPNKGETIKVELVREGGVWKVDSAVSNAPPGP
jgi:hypothetical protein